ncbi:hypothetical protein PLESTB_000484700 [Pleodorina starrii]|uniref:Uncharacterized protein n=1 Tax=Pleodorina starrii TaxID=330485 RepID=A0A9W6BFL1_9CHLO|nr:hypothetical protein PLESTM_000355900 [Pleodorina starrii]GLC51272.1 hypothetical protein PLESTB_000484700 [Pleodorina starrii]GLC63632.1 hypothetical protein PLESTF_000057600 [Pleodorina starrii]
MVLIPKVLGALSKPLQMAYKVSRLAFKLHGPLSSRKVLGVADHLLGFTLDVTGKVKLSLTLLLIKFVHGKVRCQQLAAAASGWLDNHRSSVGDTNDVLLKDLNAIFSPSKETRLATATPLMRAGLLFLRDCLDPINPADKNIAARFVQPGGQLDVQAALTAFYSTGAANKLADAMVAPSIPPNADALVSKAYDDLRKALRRDLADMLLL